MRAVLFARRNLKEILREPLSYVFCLGVPIVLLCMFQIINHYTTQTYWFSTNSLAPGIMVFSYSFIMLYMALLVSKDRSTSFLTRLYISPMTHLDFVIGYALPGIILSFLQSVICFIAVFIIGAFTGDVPAVGNSILCILSGIPAMIMFTALGIFFGALFSDKAAPGMSSIIISLGGLLSGAWMPLETMGGFGRFCEFLPFYPAVLIGRGIMAGLRNFCFFPN